MSPPYMFVKLYLVSSVCYLSSSWFVVLLRSVMSLLIWLLDSTLFLVLFVVILVLFAQCCEALYLSLYGY